MSNFRKEKRHFDTGENGAIFMILARIRNCDNDTLYGADGADVLGGGANDDVIYNGASNDTVSGGSSNDPLWGDVGDDQLSGGDARIHLYSLKGTGTIPSPTLMFS